MWRGLSCMQLHGRTRHYETVCHWAHESAWICVGGLQDLSCYGFIKVFESQLLTEAQLRLAPNRPCVTLVTCVAAIVYMYVYMYVCTQFVILWTIRNLYCHFRDACTYTIVSRVSAHGCLSIIHDFGPHGRLPEIKILYVCIEAATVAPWNAVHERLPRSGHLPGTLRYLCNKFCSMYIGAQLI